jgi:hypothetical protein
MLPLLILTTPPYAPQLLTSSQLAQKIARRQSTGVLDNGKLVFGGIELFTLITQGAHWSGKYNRQSRHSLLIFVLFFLCSTFVIIWDPFLTRFRKIMNPKYVKNKIQNVKKNTQAFPFRYQFLSIFSIQFTDDGKGRRTELPIKRKGVQ